MYSDIKCYCISLAENVYGRRECQEECERVGLDVEFEIVERSPKGGAHGCFTSHINVLKKGLATDCKYIMVLEDDVYFDYKQANIIESFYDFLETRNDNIRWCYCLGYFTNSCAKTITTNIVALNKCYCSHAYIVPRQTAEELVKMEWKEVPYDIHWHEVIDIFYAPSPMIAFQHDHESSIQQGVWQYFLNTVGFKNIAKLCEFRSKLPL